MWMGENSDDENKEHSKEPLILLISPEMKKVAKCWVYAEHMPEIVSSKSLTMNVRN